MEQRQYWDSVAETKEFTLPLQADKLERYVGKDGRILDVGCGYGRSLNQLYELGWRELVGMDFAPGMIARGKRLFPALDLRVAEGKSLGLPDESVDAVLLFAVLTCIASDREQSALVGEIHRVLKPGGVLYINDYLLNTDQRNVSRYQAFAEKYGTYGIFELPEGAICRHHSEEYLIGLLRDFEKLEQAPITFTTMNGHQATGFYFLGKKV